jgi:hypothetical protein
MEFEIEQALQREMIKKGKYKWTSLIKPSDPENIFWLDLSNKGILKLPNWCYENCENSLYILDISHNNFTDIYVEFSNLKILICKNNNISKLSLTDCLKLKYLDASHNKIRNELINFGGDELIYVNISNNYIKSIDFIETFVDLKYINASNEYLERDSENMTDSYKGIKFVTFTFPSAIEYILLRNNPIFNTLKYSEIPKIIDLTEFDDDMGELIKKKIQNYISDSTILNIEKEMINSMPNYLIGENKFIDTEEKLIDIAFKLEKIALLNKKAIIEENYIIILYKLSKYFNEFELLKIRYVNDIEKPIIEPIKKSITHGSLEYEKTLLEKRLEELRKKC